LPCGAAVGCERNQESQNQTTNRFMYEEINCFKCKKKIHVIQATPHLRIILQIFNVIIFTYRSQRLPLILINVHIISLVYIYIPANLLVKWTMIGEKSSRTCQACHANIVTIKIIILHCHLIIADVGTKQNKQTRFDQRRKTFTTWQ
jgi:hypothetical protein